MKPANYILSFFCKASVKKYKAKVKLSS